MLSRLTAGPFTVAGVSVGGIYTALKVAELDVLFDIGISPRSFVGTRHLLVSHGHADHVGALAGHIGICGLARVPAPKVFLPEELFPDLEEAMGAMARGQRRPLHVPFEPMAPLDVRHLAADLWVRAYRTQHSVPSLGYLLFRKVNKLQPEFLGLAPEELKRRRLSGELLFREEERGEVAYVTDSLIDVLDDHPELCQARCLILECTFLDEKKPLQDARKKFHVHLDEIIERAARFRCETLVLMHFSQLYSPREVRTIIAERCPPELLQKIQVLAPEQGPWPG